MEKQQRLNIVRIFCSFITFYRVRVLFNKESNRNGIPFIVDSSERMFSG